MLIDTVKSFLEKYDLLMPESNILVAFSGGYDSMCLLDIMQKLAPEYRLNLYAIHLNHNWRGKESDSEEENCKKFASGINFYSEKLPPDIPHTETAAREARYEFFERCAKKFKSKTVLTAHNANDNAETVYYRMLKGTGLTGLEGIQEKRGIYYRPLLEVYRADIEAYCKENHLTPNIDNSNFDTNYQRNKIRCEIFPKLKEFSPDIEKNLNKIAKSAQFANKIIEKKVKKLEKYTPDEFSKLDEFLQTTAVHKFVRLLNLDYDRKKIDEITQFIIANKNSKSGRTCSLTKNKWLFVNNKDISVITKTAKNISDIQIKNTGIYETSDYRFIIEPCTKMPEKFPPDNEYTAYAELDGIDFTLRTRKDGDIIQPLGVQGTKKLKKYLMEKQIPKHQRDTQIFLCRNSEILWAPGLGISEKIKVVNNPTHVLKLEKR